MAPSGDAGGGHDRQSGPHRRRSGNRRQCAHADPAGNLAGLATLRDVTAPDLSGAARRDGARPGRELRRTGPVRWRRCRQGRPVHLVRRAVDSGERQPVFRHCHDAEGQFGGRFRRRVAASPSCATAASTAPATSTMRPARRASPTASTASSKRSVQRAASAAASGWRRLPASPILPPPPSAGWKTSGRTRPNTADYQSALLTKV